MPFVVIFLFLAAPLRAEDKLPQLLLPKEGPLKVYVEKDVSWNKHFAYVGTTEASLSKVFGMYSAAAGVGMQAGFALSESDEGVALSAAMEKAGAPITAIAYQEFLKLAAENINVAKTVLVESPDLAHATIKLVVPAIGMQQAPTGFKRLKPLLALNVEVHQLDKKIYEDGTIITIYADYVEGKTYEEYLATPELLVNDYRVLSREILSDFLSGLKKLRDGKLKLLGDHLPNPSQRSK